MLLKIDCQSLTFLVSRIPPAYKTQADGIRL